MPCDAARRAAASRIANEAGFSLLESLIAILIFAVGALAMVGMFGRAITTARDAQFRTEAAVYATDLLHAIAAGVDRDPLSGDVIVSGTVNSLDKFARNPTGNLCAYQVGAGPHPVVTAWENKIRAAGTGLPWSGATSPIQVQVNAGDLNRVSISICWLAPNETVASHHVLAGHIN